MPLADTLLRMAEIPPMYGIRFTDQILAEVSRTLIDKFGKSTDQANGPEVSIRLAFPGALVKNYEHLIPEMSNHPKDRHVLAAALASAADYLVTLNLKDFPQKAATQYGVKVLGPSEFLNYLVEFDRSEFEMRPMQQAESIGSTRELLLQRLAKLVPDFVNHFRFS